MNGMQEPCLIDLNSIGEEEIGFISVAEAFSNVPFEIKRVYWTYKTPESVERGNHAHKNSQQLLVCVTGELKISLENREGKKYFFTLNNANQGLYIPSFYWRKLTFVNNAVCLCLSSSVYDENDYIRVYEDFIKK